LVKFEIVVVYEMKQFHYRKIGQLQIVNKLKFRAMKKFLAVLAVVVSSVVFGQNQTGLDPGTSS
jgi:hypothetical protein